MRLLAFFLILNSIIRSAAGDTRLVRETEALTPDRERAALHVPEGFEVQLFASEPMINKPINLAFDDRGRLWVSSTVEYPYAADKRRWSDSQGTKVEGSRDAIKILEDSDGDGLADRVIDFADGLNIPTGVLPWHKPEHKAGCIAWSIPNIWYFGDSDGDDRADVREVLFGPLGYEKDTHGMCSSFRLGWDGWIYATHGFNNTSHFKARDGSTLDLNSGNVFRFRPDASHVEIWSWGQVNPFGLCWDRRGNLYSADCHSAPIYQLLRGACYPSFGKPDDGLGFGPVMCDHNHGSTGICGVVYVDAGVWGPEWDDHMFVGNVVTSRINHDRIEYAGSTPRAIEEPDFLVSDDPWFRPVDLQLGPDGALYVADFYNKIIGHYEVPLDHPGRDKERGRIWRIMRKNGARSATPFSAVPKVGDSAASRLAALSAKSPFERRAAVAALQEEPTLEAVPALLALAAKTPAEDEQLRHALRLALREQLRLPGAFAQLSSAGAEAVEEVVLAVPTEEAAAFLVREIEEGKVRGDRVASSLTHIARYGPEECLTRSIKWARAASGSDARSAARLIQALAEGRAERGGPANSELLHWAQESAAGLLAQRTESNWAPVPQSRPSPVWSMASRRCKDGLDARVLQSMRGGGNEEKLTGVLRSKAFVAPAKLRFWICGHSGFPGTPANEKNVVRLVDAATGAVVASVLPPRSDVCVPAALEAGMHAGRPCRLEIVDGDSGRSYAWLGIGRIDPPLVSVEEFEAGEAQRSALKGLAVLLQHTAPAALREKLNAYLPPLPAPPPLIVSPEQRAQLDGLIAKRAAAFASGHADAEKGRQVFVTNCSACHQIGGQGGLIGPQLDGIGKRGVDRLCEDILDPSRNVDAHFHLHALKLRDGLTISGFVKAEIGQVTVVTDAAGQDHRVPKADVLEEQVMPMSLMPPLFGQTIPEADFINLLAWLMTR